MKVGNLPTILLLPLPRRRDDSGDDIPDLQGKSENPLGANTVPLLLLQKTPQIYSVELNGAKDMKQRDKGDDKDKYRGLRSTCLELRKNDHKERVTKEIDLVSGVGPEVKGAP